MEYDSRFMNDVDQVKRLFIPCVYHYNENECTLDIHRYDDSSGFMDPRELTCIGSENCEYYAI
jgi:hypothetical protein